jgi:hypothetical protein
LLVSRLRDPVERRECNTDVKAQKGICVISYLISDFPIDTTIDPEELQLLSLSQEIGD